jgi:hypothetical protein
MKLEKNSLSRERDELFLYAKIIYSEYRPIEVKHRARSGVERPVLPVFVCRAA